MLFHKYINSVLILCHTLFRVKDMAMTKTNKVLTLMKLSQ